MAGIKGDGDKKAPEGPQLWDDGGKGLRQASDSYGYYRRIAEYRNFNPFRRRARMVDYVAKAS